MSDLSKLQTLTLDQLLDLAHEAGLVVSIRPGVRVKYAVSVQLFSAYTERLGDISIKDTLLETLFGFCDQHDQSHRLMDTETWKSVAAKKRRPKS